jgi:hypothetical protein
MLHVVSFAEEDIWALEGESMGKLEENTLEGDS